MSGEGVSSLPASALHRREHYAQKSYWDCGVSCVVMALEGESRSRLLDNLEQVCEREGFNKSTWTIDLAYMLSG